MKYTYKQLAAEVDDWWKSLGEDGRYQWYLNPFPTFEMYVLSNIRPGDEVTIDFNTYSYEISVKQ